MQARKDRAVSNQRSKGSIMLLELILCVLIFSLCAAASISIFAQSRMEANDARALSVASIKAASAAEVFKASGGRIYEAAHLMNATCPGNFHFVVFFDDSWNEIKEDSDKRLTMGVTAEDVETGLISAKIEVSDGEKIVYELSTAVLPLAEGGDAE